MVDCRCWFDPDARRVRASYAVSFLSWCGLTGTRSNGEWRVLDLSHEDVGGRGVAARGVCLLCGCPHQAASSA